MRIRQLLFSWGGIRSMATKLCWGGRSREMLLGKLKSAVEDGKVKEAWDFYKDFKRIYGFPDKLVLAKLISEMSSSSDPIWIKKAASLVVSISRHKPELLLHPQPLTQLSLALSRHNMPLFASILLRFMLTHHLFPPLPLLTLIFHHMLSTPTGFILASNIFILLCHLIATSSPSLHLVTPDATLFNLLLHACVLFQSPIKGHQIIDFMPQLGVVADASTLVLISYIHEMNGTRDDLNKFKHHVDLVSVPLLSHYHHFYDRLLSLHFKFNDVDAASALVLDLYTSLMGKRMQRATTQLHKPCSIIIGSHHLRQGLRLHMLPHYLPPDSVFTLEGKLDLIIHNKGHLLLTNKALAKLIVLFKKNDRISELSKFLVQMHKRSDQSDYNSVCTGVVDACISLGWFETAHDILDDSKLDGKSLGPAAYKTLFAAYCNRGMVREAETLLKQMKESGDPETTNLEKDLSQCSSLYKTESIMNLEELPSHIVSSLAGSVIRELREDVNFSPAAYELNSSIYFFMKAKMIAYALKTYRRMQEMKIQSHQLTFFHMISGYSSLNMYR